MKKMLLALCLTTGTVFAQETPPQAQVTPLMEQALTDSPGKEVLMATVSYPAGAIDPIHRHNAQAFVYVLEGTIEMQVRGGKLVTLGPGQTF
jgi:quercetin dioxygenase-like cupin family protein